MIAKIQLHLNYKTAEETSADDPKRAVWSSLGCGYWTDDFSRLRKDDEEERLYFCPDCGSPGRVMPMDRWEDINGRINKAHPGYSVVLEKMHNVCLGEDEIERALKEEGLRVQQIATCQKQVAQDLMKEHNDRIPTREIPYVKYETNTPTTPDDPERAVWMGIGCTYWTDNWTKLKGDEGNSPICPVCEKNGYYNTFKAFQEDGDDTEKRFPNWHKFVAKTKERCLRPAATRKLAASVGFDLKGYLEWMRETYND